MQIPLQSLQSLNLQQIIALLTVLFLCLVQLDMIAISPDILQP
jgi:hypothetical protein